MTDDAAAEVSPAPNRGHQCALALQREGFRVLHVGTTISVQGPKRLWATVFNVSFKPQTKKLLAEVEQAVTTFDKALTDEMRIPQGLQDLIEDVSFVEPPELY